MNDQYEDMEREIEVQTNLMVTLLIESDDLSEFCNKVALIDVRQAIPDRPLFFGTHAATLHNLKYGSDERLLAWLSEEGDDSEYARIYWGTYALTSQNIIARALGKLYTPNHYRKVQ